MQNSVNKMFVLQKLRLATFKSYIKKSLKSCSIVKQFMGS